MSAIDSSYCCILKNWFKYQCLWQGSVTYSFPCDRWLARDEEDGALERELVAGKIIEEVKGKDGQVKTKEKKIKGQLVCKSTD